MKNAFVTFLATESFLPGVLVLQKSLRLYNKINDLEVMVTKSISEGTITILKSINCKVRIVAEIENPAQIANDQRGFTYMYTKLRVFEMTEYDKVVYLDSDMLICGNIELLFDSPHMSAVIAGSLVQGNDAWTDLNAGLLVIEPSQLLFNEIYSAVSNTLSKDGSDQGFLQTFYGNWSNNSDLHLAHAFNVPYNYIAAYCQYCGFSFSYARRRLNTTIAVIHYWGPIKPWYFDIKTVSRRDKSKQMQAITLWWDMFNCALNEIDET